MFNRIKHKFGAKRTTIDDINFSSKKEAKRYLQLKKLEKAGEVVFFLRQIPFFLSEKKNAKVKYICDFQIFWSDGTVTFEDVKGMRTTEYVTKKKLVEAKYPIEIVES
jgi:hypothetical protein